MSAVESFRRRLTDLGERRGFRVAVAIVFSLIVVGSTIVVGRTAWRLDRMLKDVEKIVATVDLSKGDPIAKQLVEKGTLDYAGRQLGADVLAPRFARFFNEQGRIDRVSDATMLLVGSERPDWMPAAFANQPLFPVMLGVAALVVINFACFSGLALPLLGVTVGGALLWGGALFFGRPDLAVNFAAIPAFLLSFGLLVRVLLMLTDRATPMMAVANGVVREAMRLKVAVFFASIAIVVIPLLPIWLDASSPLRYQVQTYLSRSMDAMYLVCAFLTVFFGCATVAFEIRDRQAWMTLTKPVSRLSWMAGKWLGLVALNAAILTTCTLAMLAFLSQVRARTALDMLDLNAVTDEVLVARAGGLPEYRFLEPARLEAMVKEAIAADPNARADIKDGRRTELEVQKTFARSIAEDYVKIQRSIGPQEEERYLFTGLSSAREAKANLSLRYRFYSGMSDPNELYPVMFFFGGSEDAPAAYRQFVAAQANVISVPASAIEPDGTLVIRISNWRYNPNAGPGEPRFTPGPGSISFDPDGLELLYKVGDFGPNLLRAQLVNLLKLSFLAMLAATLSSFLSFPVACLVVFTVFAAGSLGPYLATSIDEYRIRTDSSFIKDIEAAIRGIASATEFMVRSFGQARASGPLVEGRLVSWDLVLRTLALIGVAWSGVVLVVGFGIFRRKELAIYSGQGG